MGWIVLSGCASSLPPVETASQQKALKLLLPDRIEIVEPFTRIRSFDNDATPDGIELLIQAVNALDNPGLMITGEVRVELYEFVPASGDHKGKRLEHWVIQLSSKRDQQTFWNSLTRMYEFRLGINPAKIPAADRYVLSITYNSPFGRRLNDERVIRSLDAVRRTPTARP